MGDKMLTKELELLAKLFDEGERRSNQEIIEHYQKGLCKIQTTTNKEYEDEIESIIIYRDLNEFIFIEYFGLNPKYQGKGKGTKILNNFIKSVGKLVVLEVEKVDNEIKQRRVDFYQRLGFYYHDDEYYMPSFETENEKIPLKLMSYPTEMTTQQISKYRQLIWKEVYQQDYERNL